MLGGRRNHSQTTKAQYGMNSHLASEIQWKIDI